MQSLTPKQIELLGKMPQADREAFMAENSDAHMKIFNQLNTAAYHRFNPHSTWIASVASNDVKPRLDSVKVILENPGEMFYVLAQKQNTMYYLIYTFTESEFKKYRNIDQLNAFVNVRKTIPPWSLTEVPSGNWWSSKTNGLLVQADKCNNTDYVAISNAVVYIADDVFEFDRMMAAINYAASTIQDSKNQGAKPIPPIVLDKI